MLQYCFKENKTKEWIEQEYMHVGGGVRLKSWRLILLKVDSVHGFA